MIVANRKLARPALVDVNLAEAAELRYWCEMCRCTEADLKAAVKAVGTSADHVIAYLKKRETARLLWREGVR